MAGWLRRRKNRQHRSAFSGGSPLPVVDTTAAASGSAALARPDDARRSRLLDEVARLDGRDERAEIVHVAMQPLNERQRMALLLSKFEGCTGHYFEHQLGLTP